MERFKRYKIDNMGVTLLELIIAIGIMAVLTSVLVPQYLKYLNRSQKAVDITNAALIADAFQRALIEYPDAYDTYGAWRSAKKHVYVYDKDGVTLIEQYDVYLVMANEDDYNYAFYGGVNQFKGKNGKPGLYDYVNQAIGISRSNTQQQNSKMNPKFKVKDPTGAVFIDRWRICKRMDGMLEVWAAYDRGMGSGDAGGNPCYRLWPNPCPLYTE